MSPHLPSLAEAKTHAKRLRADLAEQGSQISHAAALELVAHQNGFADWNGYHAAIGNRPPEGWAVGGRVQGRYLSQPFTATLIAVEMQRSGWFRLVLDLDEAVDVVTFDSFSNFRKRIQAVVGPEGKTRERTSDGCAHLQLD